MTWLAMRRSVKERVIPRVSYFSFRLERMSEVFVVGWRTLKLFRNLIRLLNFFGLRFLRPKRNSKCDINGSCTGAG